MEKIPDTLKNCLACGGIYKDCKWCTNGLMNEKQLLDWINFKQQRRSISGTYNFLESTTKEIIEKLELLDLIDLAIQGKQLLTEWDSAYDKSEVTNKLTIFHKTALEEIIKFRII